FKWDGKIVGWTSRATFTTHWRYFTEVQPHYLFNTEVLDNDWKYVIIVEGPFDALAVNGISALGGSLTPEQCKWINQSGKTPIVLPDLEKKGESLIDIALREGWH